MDIRDRFAAVQAHIARVLKGGKIIVVYHARVMRRFRQHLIPLLDISANDKPFVILVKPVKIVLHLLPARLYRKMGILFSCEKEDAPPVDPITLPIANFYVSVPQFRTYKDQTYAYITAYNGSKFSTHWKWDRTGSYEILTGITEFTTDQDTAVTQAYLVTNQEQRFNITLIAYSEVKLGIDSIITYESHPFTQEVVIKKKE